MVAVNTKSHNHQNRASLSASQQRGFSIVEVMISVLMLSILTGVGIPVYRDFIATQQLRGVTTDLRIALVTARSEAVKRNRTVALMPNTDGWGDGWQIPDPASADEFLYRHKQSGAVVITGPGSIQFTPAGRPALTLNTRFEIDVGGDNAKACLTIGLDGRASSVEGPCP